MVFLVYFMRANAVDNFLSKNDTPFLLGFLIWFDVWRQIWL